MTFFRHLYIDAAVTGCTVILMIAIAPTDAVSGGIDRVVRDISADRQIAPMSEDETEMEPTESQSSPTSDSTERNHAAPPLPGDVLNPDARGNTPNLKLAFKGGFHRSSYSNDRYPDNRPFDVGPIYGEDDVYGSAAGFGLQFGVELEFPQNTVFSWSTGLRYDHVFFENSGIVGDACTTADGDTVSGTSFHEFDVIIDYLKLSGAAKLNFRSFYLLFGLTAATPLSNGIQFNRTSGDEQCFYPGGANDLRNSRDRVELPEASRLHFALRLGGGMIFQLSDRLQFSPELTLDFGFNAINKSPQSDLGVYAISGVFRYDL